MSLTAQASGIGAAPGIGPAFVLLFAIATAVAIGAGRLRIPYPIALVVAGLVLGAFNVPAPHLTQELLFALALPGLVFEAAFNLRLAELRRNWRTLFLLAVPGVAIAIALTATVTPLALRALGEPARHLAGPLLIFAALISATDPVAVLALFRRLGAPPRLTLLVEAESLLNDATAIVFFLAALALVTGQTSAPAAALNVTERFVVELIGGAAVGVVVGGASAVVIAQVGDPMVEITLTVVAAYGSFAVAQELGLSGVLATVAAGVLCGHDVARRGMTATTRVAVGTFWEYGAFALNSIVFLLIGFEVHLHTLVAAWRPVLAGFVVVLIARAVVVAGVTALVRPTAERIPWRWSVVLSWGGVRGALSMVLALALPVDLPDRALLIAMTFGVVTLSLLGQGLSMPVVLRRLGLSQASAPLRRFEAAREEFRAARAAIEELDYLTDAGVIPTALEGRLRERYAPRLARAELRLHDAVAGMGNARPVTEGPRTGVVLETAGAGGRVEEPVTRFATDEAARRVERYLLDVERDRLNDALRAGQLPAEAYEHLVAELDTRRAALAEQ